MTTAPHSIPVLKLTAVSSLVVDKTARYAETMAFEYRSKLFQVNILSKPYLIDISFFQRVCQ